MRAVHFDPFSGASGDMVLGALADAGASDDAALAEIAALEGALASTLPFDVSLAAKRVVRRGIAGTRVEVVCKEAHAPHRGLGDLLDILAAADLPPRVRELSERTFRALAAAEAAVHGTTVDEVRFHEIGAADTLVDVIGSHWLIEKLCCSRGRGLRPPADPPCGTARERSVFESRACTSARVTSGPVAVGSGTVVAAHGELPVPAPATAELLKDVPLRGSSSSGELTTPTGAALLVTLAQSFGPMPPMKVAAIGYGFGSRQDGPGPNALRVFVGEAAEGPSGGPSPGSVPGEDEVAVIETTVDDMPGEWLGRLFETLSGQGALEVSTTPVGMKKSRPGVRVTVIAHASDARGLAEALLRETTTFGVRLRTERRIVLDREFVEAQTRWGGVRVKIGRLAGELIQVVPEYEDCARLADSEGVPIKDVYEEALAAYRRSVRDETPL